MDSISAAGRLLLLLVLLAAAATSTAEHAWVSLTGTPAGDREANTAGKLIEKLFNNRHRFEQGRYGISLVLGSVLSAYMQRDEGRSVYDVLFGAEMREHMIMMNGQNLQITKRLVVANMILEVPDDLRLRAKITHMVSFTAIPPPQN